MSHPTLGVRYFTAREQLSRVMRGVDHLARETATPLAHRLPLVEDPEADDQPFLFVACGEVNCGRSSFLNALLHAPELCPVSELPQNQPIRHYVHGPEAQDLGVGPHLQRCLRPQLLLRRYEVVDTPGIRPDKDNHLLDQIRLMERADLIFCVLPVTNPWSAATWNFMAGLAPSLRDRVVLIIQQIDQREPADIAVMRDHLTDLTTKKLDYHPPLFAVSARRELGGEESGFDALRRHINRHLEQLDSRRERLGGWLREAEGALSRVEERIEEQARRLREQDEFLAGIEDEIHDMRESFLRRLPHHLIDVAETFEKEAGRVSRLLHRRLGALPSLIRLISGERTAPTIEKLLIEHIQAAVERIAEQDSGEVVESCSEHWQQLEQRILADMGIRLTSESPIGETLSASRERFIRQLRHAAEMGINNLKVRHQLEKEIRTRNLKLKSFAVSGLVLVLAGAVCGILEFTLAPWLLIGGGAVFLSLGALAAWVSRRRILLDFREHLQDTCGAFAHTMEGDFEQALQVVFRDYAGALSQIREHFAREKLAIEPRQKAWQHCFLSLKTIEQELG